MKQLTFKQRQVIKIVIMGNIDVKGTRLSNVDVYQLKNRLDYETSRDSLMCSLAILEKQGWITKAGKELRDGRQKQTLAPTAQAIRVMNPTPISIPDYEEIELDDDIVELAML